MLQVFANIPYPWNYFSISCIPITFSSNIPYPGNFFHKYPISRKPLMGPHIWNFMVMAYFVLTLLGFRSYNTACKFIRSLPYILTLPHYLGVSWIWRQSPALPYGSPYLPDKIIFWAFLCLSLRFTPFLAQNLNFSHSQYCFWGICAHI